MPGYLSKFLRWLIRYPVKPVPPHVVILELPHDVPIEFSMAEIPREDPAGAILVGRPLTRVVYTVKIGEEICHVLETFPDGTFEAMNVTTGEVVRYRNLA